MSSIRLGNLLQRGPEVTGVCRDQIRRVRTISSRQPRHDSYCYPDTAIKMPDRSHLLISSPNPVNRTTYPSLPRQTKRDGGISSLPRSPSVIPPPPQKGGLHHLITREPIRISSREQAPNSIREAAATAHCRNHATFLRTSLSLSLSLCTPPSQPVLILASWSRRSRSMPSLDAFRRNVPNPRTAPAMPMASPAQTNHHRCHISQPPRAPSCRPRTHAASSVTSSPEREAAGDTTVTGDGSPGPIG